MSVQWIDLDSSSELMRVDESLPSTQPSLTFEDKENNQEFVWGMLIGLKKYFSDISLRSSHWSIGRQNDINDYVLKVPEIPLDCIEQFSRIHFRLRRSSETEHEVILTDESRNGTFVNGELVGNGKERPLIHYDIISLSHKDRKAFQFLFQSHKNFELFSMISSSTLSSKYILSYKIGEGSCGKVFLGYSKDENYEKVAIKVISKTSASSHLSFSSFESEDTESLAEVNILKKLSHPCIISLKDVFNESEALYIILELAVGGELFDYVYEDYNRGTLNENVSKFQFYQICKGMEYCHKQHVCHRDIKLENLLLKEKNRTSCIKISDFGLAKLTESNRLMSSFVGTFGYLAPEVVLNSTSNTGVYTNKADMWSLGCILYSLVTGSPAFYGLDDAETKSRILSGDFDVSSGFWSAKSKNVKSLIKKLLTSNANHRISASEALSHPWFTSDPFLLSEAELVMRGAKKWMDDSFLCKTLTEDEPDLSFQFQKKRKNGQLNYLVNNHKNNDINNSVQLNNNNNNNNTTSNKYNNNNNNNI